MAWKKIGKALLFPPIPIAILLLPVAAAALVCTMVLLGTETVPSYFAYALAAYTLAVWCARIPAVLRFWRRFQAEDPRARRWREDARLRVKVSLYSAIVWNGLYGIFQIWLGIYHQTFWFGALGVYYLCLAAMRFFLAGHTLAQDPQPVQSRAEMAMVNFLPGTPFMSRVFSTPPSVSSSGVRTNGRITPCGQT